MRLWHKDLIDVLPRQQLLGQWRELCAIMRNIEAKGTPGHILVNRVMDYPCVHLYIYAMAVEGEMLLRGYRVDFERFEKPFSHVYGDGMTKPTTPPIGIDGPFPGWMNDRYLRQCYYNLEEKHDGGGITDEEWQRVEDRCRKVLGDID